jgi:DNA-binding MarR family transcriptional regulator
MRRHLQTELHQKRPFESLEEEVCLEILRTSQVTGRWVAEALKPHALTPAQFNVLRILRGARPETLSSSGIAERMINHDPDLTRLLDRLEARGLIERARDARDRRVLNVGITKEGLTLVGAASNAVRARLESGMRPLGKRELDTLADLLERMRGYTE